MPGSGWGRGGRIKGGGERERSASTVRGVGRAGACPGASPAAAARRPPRTVRYGRDCAPQASVQVSLPRSSARIAHHAERRLGMLLARRLPVEGLP